ncbi:serine/threonine-protein kinase [Nocardia huaxiensis]|uniref:non-specific serine/threonine protein kinase n=1 Tax=Nocardia huaxiensis TaxID=2755382 RepID=A0A7D6VD58_9NOCA|nr:serine/threonine-protein kinase [Nocardia huaxiensis]QLY33712.1 serine/threonine protein kinase [Nocardia huaxiensis]UFS99365.1 serine/threonine protein kinase [Nocardia huaxiensis]
MPARELIAGTVFAEHLITGFLGSGGMGTVYTARHPRLPRTVALKILDPVLNENQRFSARFDREADLVARLDHPNIVDVYDRGIEDGTPWVSMRYVSGGDVGQLLRRHRGGLSAQRAVHIVAEVAKGLDHAHEQGIVHRDVKPANIFLAEDDRVLIGDFGIARSAARAVTLTTGPIALTPAYAAPEQLAGGQADRRTDVYALGVTLHELLTGSLIGSGVPATPPSPRLAAVIATATSYDPAMRYGSCGALAAAATAALTKDRARRIPWLPLAAVVLVVVAVAAGVIALPRGGDPQAQPVPSIVRFEIPTSLPLLCPVPYLKSDRGAVAFCTQFDDAANLVRWGSYFPVTGEWFPQGPYTPVDRAERIEPQLDGTLFVGVGFVRNEATGRVAGAGHRYSAAHDEGEFALGHVSDGLSTASPRMAVCPADLSEC